MFVDHSVLEYRVCWKSFFPFLSTLCDLGGSRHSVSYDLRLVTRKEEEENVVLFRTLALNV